MKDAKYLLDELYTELFEGYRKNDCMGSCGRQSGIATIFIQNIVKAMNIGVKVNEDQGHFLRHLIFNHLRNPEVGNPSRCSTDQSDLFKAISLATWINSCHE